MDKRDSRVGHRCVRQLFITLSFIFSFWTQVGVPHKHVFARNTNEVQRHEPVVLRAVPDLRTDISHLNSYLHLVRVHVSDGNDEVVDSVGLALNYELRLHERVISVDSELAWPVLDSCCVWRLQNEFLFLFIVGSRRSETLNV